MWFLLFTMVLFRFTFCLCCVMVALLLAAVGLVPLLFGRRDVAREFWQAAIRTAMFADNHRRWLLPNTQQSRRY